METDFSPCLKILLFVILTGFDLLYLVCFLSFNSAEMLHFFKKLINLDQRTKKIFIRNCCDYISTRCNAWITGDTKVMVQVKNIHISFIDPSFSSGQIFVFTCFVTSV